MDDARAQLHVSTERIQAKLWCMVHQRPHLETITKPKLQVGLLIVEHCGSSGLRGSEH